MATSVRLRVRLRDGRCRLGTVPGFPPCEGPSEWAHLAPRQRWQTRGRPPEERHTTTWSAMLCRRAHRAYDRHELQIEAEDGTTGADGILRFEADGGAVYYG